MISSSGFVFQSLGERKPPERDRFGGGGVLLCIAQNQLAELERGLIWSPEVGAGSGVVDKEYLDLQNFGVRFVADVLSDVLLGPRLTFISAEVGDLLRHKKQKRSIFNNRSVEDQDCIVFTVMCYQKRPEKKDFIAPSGRRPIARGSTADYQVCVIVVTISAEQMSACG